MKRFVILGGGYGGLTIAQELLDKRIPEDTIIMLIDRMPFQGLKTEYYALAAGTVADIELRNPFPSDPRLVLTYGEVKEVDLDGKLIHIAEQDPISYDWLAIALGCTDKYHGIPGADIYSSSIQTFSNARKTYQRLGDVKPYGQVTIVGGGLSGVEVAAELRESRSDLNIRIMDRGPSVMSGFPPRLQKYVASWFHEHDVVMLGNTSISRLEEGVIYDRADPVASDVTIWTAGIQPIPLVQQLNLPKDSGGRLVINEYHQLPDYPGVFVVGDCASLPFSPSAQAAGAQGSQVAEVLQAIWDNETPQLGKIKLRGVLGSLGKKAGFGMMGKAKMYGWLPRMLKSGVLWKSKHHFG
ncbi:NADH dehydrogenase [Paenibacillus darwinianus]|uniref:NADH dehydrogenase n=1 Tax=Paenibacillus darwinianus TaxID=1380763 RepID=A0A9W5W7W5_9BACL|nr:NAD(P)/FAD-dependent oxidoreductase [Paenibacillus darwinianus]EXX87771.1 NADH dehydrogenase [Paenibacillus darwinianus]EXX89216.1 NADH dehydrogenase [Paenibacillus darwinianus]EXX90072.1 NADH dehydrogenase [Paenibacillus darwinianus]